ncbi:MAG TPA: efflux RND transporter periplasmic adaptor subunit, partial [Thermoanaerobaculia bacterium]|nr:efflux RND transporter periplasmic adaptor subunit [Thermoanaerobaculia bacterium]
RAERRGQKRGPFDGGAVAASALCPLRSALRLTLLPLALIVACKREAPPKPAPPPMRIERASVASVTKRYVATGPRLSGTLQPQQSASILAETAGTVTSVSAAEGQSVGRGAELARISDATASDALASARVAVQSAQTAVAVARRDYERTQRLASAGALPKKDIDVTRSQVATAEAQLGQARAQLATAQDRAGNQRVASAVSGIVSEKRVSVGDVVAPGAPLFTIVDLSTLQLEATVPADAIAQVNPGTSVELEVRGYPGQTFRGTVTRVAPSVDPGTGQVRVYIAMPNQGKRLVGGLFAEGTVRTVARMGLVLPIEALDESGAALAVVRVRNGVTERVNVQLGMRSDAEGFVEILSGLAEGDVVLIGPARTITPGTRVNVS